MKASIFLFYTNRHVYFHTCLLKGIDDINVSFVHLWSVRIVETTINVEGI